MKHSFCGVLPECQVTANMTDQRAAEREDDFENNLGKKLTNVVNKRRQDASKGLFPCFPVRSTFVAEGDGRHRFLDSFLTLLGAHSPEPASLDGRGSSA
jgi:hypothetical protein